MNYAIITTFALLAIVNADVAHLNNMYLPPKADSLKLQQHVSYGQQTAEIPQSSLQEVLDNSVLEDALAQEEVQKASGQLVVEKFKGLLEGNVPAGVIDQHVQITADVANQVQAAQQAAAAVLVEKPAASEVQKHEQYSTATIVQSQKEANIDVVKPQQKNTHHPNRLVEEKQKYSADHIEHHADASAPVIQEFAQQPAGEHSALVGSSVSGGIDTQYATNGGYVY